MMESKFVEVFKTDVRHPRDARLILQCLSSLIDPKRITFDLEDVDCVLRVAASTPVNTVLVVHVLKSFGFNAVELQDVVPASVGS
jgi:hypothetical protein